MENKEPVWKTYDEMTPSEQLKFRLYGSSMEIYDKKLKKWKYLM